MIKRIKDIDYLVAEIVLIACDPFQGIFFTGSSGEVVILVFSEGKRGLSIQTMMLSGFRKYEIINNIPYSAGSNPNHATGTKSLK